MSSKDAEWSNDNASFKQRFEDIATLEFAPGFTISLEQAPGSEAEDQATIWWAPRLPPAPRRGHVSRGTTTKGVPITTIRCPYHNGWVSLSQRDSAFVLSALMHNEDVFPKGHFAGKTVIELGSGTGCVGINAAQLGATCVLTDLKPILPLLQRNIDRNVPQGNTSHARECEWGSDTSSWPEIPCDILLGSDIQPFIQDQEALVETMAAVSSPATEIYIGLKHRWKDVDKWFMEEVAKYFDHVVIDPAHFHPRWRADDIEVLRLTKRAE